MFDPITATVPPMCEILRDGAWVPVLVYTVASGDKFRFMTEPEKVYTSSAQNFHELIQAFKDGAMQ